MAIEHWQDRFDDKLDKALEKLESLCTQQGRHDERICSLERFRAGVWAIGMVVVTAIVAIIAKIGGR
jgi:hypothetical protein